MSDERAERRVHLVTGKGGTGRTTTALALALGLAKQGHRTLVAELGADGGLGRASGVSLEAPRTIAPRCSAASLAPGPALDALLEAYLPSRRLAAWAKRNVALRALLGAAPATVEVSQLDAILRSLRELDRVVIDAEPTGQTLQLLDLPHVFRGLGARGALGDRLAAIEAMLLNETVVHVTTLERAVVVEETAELARGLLAKHAALGLLVVTGPPPIAASKESAARALAACAGTAAEEDLRFLHAAAAEAEAAHEAIPPGFVASAAAARRERPTSIEALAALGTELMRALEAP